MAYIEGLLAQLPSKLAVSLMSAAILALLALTSRALRALLFYSRHEFELDYTSGWDGCDWDIQWEGFRLTVRAEGVHNDYIEKIIIKKDGANPGLTFERVETSDAFITIERWPIQFKLNSIIRTAPVSGGKLYRLNFVVRRRRW